ncbi:MAG: sensor domain-containing diguanylate cyclase [Lactobacillus sp.]|jgi:diguanylate cyclase (GGDEF)-like protein|nr:sensor domain-containing diguanylate cyclase [Lactobacillus sp.]
MTNLEVFNSGANLTFTIACLLVLMFSSIYSSKGNKYGKGILYLFIGMMLDFIASWFGSNINELASVGVPVEILVFIELAILLISMVFLALAASQFLINNVPDVIIIAAILAIGISAILYFVMVNPDGDMVNNMRSIFPIAGLVYISASFWSQSSQSKSGSIMAAVSTTLVSFLLILRLFGWVLTVSNAWYIAPALYVALSMSVLMIKTDSFVIRLRESEDKIQSYNKRIEEIIKLSPFPILISRLSDDKIVLANNNAVKLFEMRYDEIDHYKLKDFFAEPDARHALTERLEKETEVQDFEVLVTTPNNRTPFWLLASANIIDYNYDIAIYTAFQDITTRKTRENLLKNQAIRDPLTSLFNRRYFEEEVSKRISLARVDGSSYSVMMVDADHFKRVNDTYGHKTGDKVLIELANTCEKALRDDDIVARYGGEEFVIFLSKTDAEKAKSVAERLRETVASLAVNADDGSEVKFTISIGISSSEVSDNIDNLIKTADEALYRAKENGRNRSEIFTVKDMENFKVKEESEEENESHLHPIFSKENEEEISLLDGAENQPVINETKTTE